MIEDIGNVAHYSRLEHLEKILKNKFVRLGPVSELNDPRESSLGWIDTCGNGHDYNIQDLLEANELKESVGSSLRLFCASQCCEDDLLSFDALETKAYGRPRMWAQYGDNSKGFCVILDKNSFHNEIESQVDNLEHLIAGKVEYIDWLSIVSGGATIEYGKGIPSSKNRIFEIINSNQMLKSLYFNKSIDWGGEKEFRWLMYSESKQDTLVPIQNSIKAVVLGWKFPPERYSEVKAYCADLGCSCFILNYQHPSYKLIPLSK
jgi:hypothetical protein